MMKGSMGVLVLSAALLILPGTGFAGASDNQPPAAAKKKAAIDQPSNCRLKGKVLAPGANNKRRQLVAERRAKGELGGAKITHNPEAARRHGRKQQN